MGKVRPGSTATETRALLPDAVPVEGTRIVPHEPTNDPPAAPVHGEALIAPASFLSKRYFLADKRPLAPGTGGRACRTTGKGKAYRFDGCWKRTLL